MRVGVLGQKIRGPSGCVDVARGKRVARDERRRNRVGDDREDRGAPKSAKTNDRREKISSRKSLKVRHLSVVLSKNFLPVDSTVGNPQRPSDRNRSA